jgi:hypothetical protein
MKGGKLPVQIEGAVIREQGQVFAVVIVRASLASAGQHGLSKAASAFSSYFPGMPIVLMWQDGRGVPMYWGRQDIVKFLANLDISQIPWRRYNTAA